MVKIMVGKKGSGKTKKSAQQQAARAAIDAIENGEVCI